MALYCIVAGEPSGDIHAARLMKALRLRDANAEFIGIGGDAMVAQGLVSLVPLSTMSVIGFIEVAKRYSYFTSVLASMEALLSTRKVDAFIPVDYPGFNMRLAVKAKALSIPVLWYIAPQLWAWGVRRAQKLSALVDELFVVFPFEVDFFNAFSIPTTFVGHPLLDDSVFGESVTPLQGRSYRACFLPGSRHQEITRHLPLCLSVADRLHAMNSNIECVIAKSPALPEEIYTTIIASANSKQYITLRTDTRNLLKTSAVSMVKAGTSTLEAALCGSPMTTFYKTSLISYLVSKKLISLPYISLVNILANAQIVPERIQHEATAEALANDLYDLLTSDSIAKKQHQYFQILHTMLRRDSTSVSTTADFVAERIIAILTKRSVFSYVSKQ